MDIKLQQDVEEIHDEFVIVSKNFNDIVEDLNLKSDEERFIYESIIHNLEKTAGDTIRGMKIAQLPFIGCVRVNPVKRELRDSLKGFKTARKYMTKDEYKEHVRQYVLDIKLKHEKEDRLKIVYNNIRRNNKKKYEDYYKQFGKEYADLFIFSFTCFKVVDFNQEWEDLYQRLKD